MTNQPRTRVESRAEMTRILRAQFEVRSVTKDVRVPRTGRLMSTRVHVVHGSGPFRHITVQFVTRAMADQFITKLTVR